MGTAITDTVSFSAFFHCHSPCPCADLLSLEDVKELFAHCHGFLPLVAATQFLDLTCCLLQ